MLCLFVLLFEKKGFNFAIKSIKNEASDTNIFFLIYNISETNDRK